MDKVQSDPGVYSPVARRFHWLTAALVIIMVPLGIIMSDDANPFKFSDAFVGQLNSTHKLIGFVIFWLVIARLVYRLRNGAPASDPSLTAWQRGASHATHGLLYLLMIGVSLGGWIGVSLYGAREIFGVFSLPALTSVNQKQSETVFFLHWLGAMSIAALVAVHFGAALYHHFIRKDGVLRRMWPGLSRR